MEKPRHGFVVISEAFTEADPPTSLRVSGCVELRLTIQFYRLSVFDFCA
jgi:hypothetical protein